MRYSHNTNNDNTRCKICENLQIFPDDIETLVKKVEVLNLLL